ncbi:MAG: ParB N-terminal domain-containing protein [Ahrensia sp.]|nr:ParB N-terminal domain-containing protein [Ahrensia sp.]
MSTLFKSIPMDKIEVPTDRSRLVDEDHAVAINASIVEHGLLTPILVRSTPNGKKPYTLVAGAHRYRAMQQLEEAEIDCVVFKGDRTDAALAEVTENVFRNELSVLDRAVSVQFYRHAWEEKHGEIRRGNPEFFNSAKFAELSPMDIITAETAAGFSQYCAEKLGLSERTIRNLNRIALHIYGELRTALRTTYPQIADNQSMLLKFCDLTSAQRHMLVGALKEAEGDAQKVLDAFANKPAPLPLIQRRYQASLDAFSRLNLAQKREAVAEMTARLKLEEERQAKREATRAANAKTGGGQIDLEDYLEGDEQ